MSEHTSESKDSLIDEINVLRWKVQDLEKEVVKVKSELADLKTLLKEDLF